MSTNKLWTQAPKAASAITREELRRRILAVVSDRGQTTEAEIWRADAPDYLPWETMIAEIKILATEQQLRFEELGPGQRIIHAVAVQPITPTPAAKKRSAKQTAKTAKPAAVNSEESREE